MGGPRRANESDPFAANLGGHDHQRLVSAVPAPSVLFVGTPLPPNTAHGGNSSQGNTPQPSSRPDCFARQDPSLASLTNIDQVDAALCPSPPIISCPERSRPAATTSNAHHGDVLSPDGTNVDHTLVKDPKNRESYYAPDCEGFFSRLLGKSQLWKPAKGFEGTNSSSKIL